MFFPHVRLSLNGPCNSGTKCERSIWGWAKKEPLTAGRGRQQWAGAGCWVDVGKNSPMNAWDHPRGQCKETNKELGKTAVTGYSGRCESEMHGILYRDTEVAHLTSSIHAQDFPLSPSLRTYRSVAAADVLMCFLWDLVVAEASAGCIECFGLERALRIIYFQPTCPE